MTKPRAKQPLAFRLRTVAEPALTFAINDDLYHLYSTSHLTREQEVRLRWLLRRFDALQERIEKLEGDEEEGMKVASQLRDIEVEIITMITDVPEEVAQALPLSARGRLYEEIAKVVRNEFGAEGEGE